MEVTAILMIESVKPLSYVGSQMGCFFLSPFIHALYENVGISGEKLFQIFEKHDNVEKLIKAVDELKREEEEKKKAEKTKKLKNKSAETETGEAPKNNDWPRLLPF